MKKVLARTRMGTTSRIVNTIVVVLFGIYAVTLLFPFVWGLVSSLKSPLEYYHAFQLPETPLFSNYVRAIEVMAVEGISFLEMLWNSIWFSVGSTLITVYSTAITAYVMSMFEFRGRKFLYALSVLIMVVPIYGSLPAQYKFYWDSGLADSYWILLSATGGLIGFNFIMMHGYYKNVSKSYMEAAIVEGASNLRIFNSIMLPISKPMVMAVFMSCFIANWNNYLSPILYLPNRLTLSAGLYKYQEIAENYGDYPVYFAASFLFVLPVLVLFGFLCNTMMENMTIGGLKA